jgi:hypothetical protein
LDCTFSNCLLCNDAYLIGLDIICTYRHIFLRIINSTDTTLHNQNSVLTKLIL